MDAEYFKNQICDELCGAKDYIKKAIELKPMNATWSKTLMEMSAAELSHATNLYKMFIEYYDIMAKKYEEVPDYLQDIRSDIIDCYAEKSALVKTLHEMYSK